MLWIALHLPLLSLETLATTLLHEASDQPLALIEVLDADPRALHDEKLATSGDLEAALACYRAGQFAEAASHFAALAARCPEDGAARALHERCVDLLAAPPKGWSGVLSLATK